MTGTLINAGTILIAVVFSFFLKRQLPDKFQHRLKALIGAATFFIGIKLMVKSFDPGFKQGAALLLISFVSLIIGNIIGKALKLQKYSNKAGSIARQQMERGLSGEKLSFGDGLVASAIAFCLNPIGIIGAISDGASSNFYILVIKSAMDGLAGLTFAKIFGRLSVSVSIIPLLAWQGFISLVSIYFVKSEPAPTLLSHSFESLCGLFCFIFVLPVLEIRKVELANYLPSIFVAPVLTRLFL